MRYYIFYSQEEFNNKKNSGVFIDVNILGNRQFKNFWAQTGWKILQKSINSNNINILEDIIIIKDNGQKLTVEEFLSEIETLTIISER